MSLLINNGIRFFPKWWPAKILNKSERTSFLLVDCVCVDPLFRCSDLLHLAVLHPRKLSVYSISGNLYMLVTSPLCHPSSETLISSLMLCASGTAGNVEHGDQYQLKLVYEHNLQRTACSMTFGTFGGVTGTAVNQLASFMNTSEVFVSNHPEM